MRAFHFRLQALLNLREQTREEALAAYAESISKREHEQELEAAAARSLEQNREAMAARREGGFRGAEQSAYLRAIDSAKNALVRQRAKLARAKLFEERTRAAFLEADGAVKSLDRLKERRRDEHFRSEMKKEEHELEDVIGARYALRPAT